MRPCDQCGKPISGRAPSSKRCSRECDDAAHRAQVARSYAARSGIEPEVRSCAWCGERIVDRRRKRYCSPDCEDEGARQQARERYAQQAGEGYRPVLAKRVKRAVEYVSPAELEGRRRCGDSRCGRFVAPEEAICGDCLPRFDARPVERATHDDLAHATYGGASVAAQAMDMAPGIGGLTLTTAETRRMRAMPRGEAWRNYRRAAVDEANARRRL